ncbi:MAG: phage tail tape measure protein [Deltaproteobacteria bacterium]|nr:phage tail tape measure protein [Deltaproteobacteria bacterium]
MPDMRLYLEMIGNSAKLKTELGHAKTAVSGFAQGAKREFENLKNSLNSVTAKLAGLGISIGMAKEMRDSALLDKSLTQIGQTAGASREEVKTLRADLFAMSRQTGQDAVSLKEGFNALVQSGLSMKEAKETLEGVNVAMAVTGANAQTLAGGLTVAATAFEFDLQKPGKALELLDKLTVAGRLGNAELENLSGIFARVGVNASSAGMGFEKTLGFIEALSMVERQPERLATLADSTLRVFTNLRYMMAAQGATGVKFFDASGARRDALDVLKDIKIKYDALKTDKDRALFVQRAFGHADLDTIKGIKTLLQGDTLSKVSSFSRQIGEAGGTLKRDLGEATDNLIDQGGRLKNVLKQAADEFVKPINKSLAGGVKKLLDPKKEEGYELGGKELIMGGAAALGGAVLMKKIGGKLIGGLAERFLGNASGIAQGKAIEAATGVTPVFITNWPVKFMRGESSPIDALRQNPAGDIAEAAGAATLLGKLKTLFTTRGAEGLLGAGKGLGALRTGATLATAGLGTSALLVGGTAAAAYGIGSVLNKGLDAIIKKMTGEDKGLGGVISDWLHSDAIKNTINIKIDKDGRIVQEGNMKTEITVNRGSFDHPVSAY